MKRSEIFAWFLLGVICGVLLALYLTRHTTPPTTEATQAEWRRPMAYKKAAGQ